MNGVQVTVYHIPLIIGSLIASLLAVQAWRQKNALEARSLAGLLAVIAFWQIGYTLEISSPTTSLMVFWSKVQWLGIVLIPAAFFLFGLAFSGNLSIKNARWLLLLAVQPVVTLSFVWTNDYHGWFWTSLENHTVGGAVFLVKEYGFWYDVDNIYGYILIFAALALLIRQFTNAPHLYRRQIVALILGSLFPIIADLGTASGLNPYPYLDLIPLSFTLTGLVLSWGFLKFGLMDIVPIAREMILEKLPDAVYLLDQDNRLRDINPAGEVLIGRPALEVVGQPVREVFARWTSILEEFREVNTGNHEIAAEIGGQTRYFDLQITPFQDQNSPVPNRLLVLREITDRVLAETALRQAQSELEDRVTERTSELEMMNESLKQSEDRYRGLFDGVPVGIYRALPTGEIADANPALIRMVGYPDRESFLRTRLTDHLTSEDQIQARQDQLKAYGVVENFELRASRYDGSEITIEDNSHAICNPSGDILYYEGSWRDITQQEKVEEALRESQESLRQKADHLDALRRVSQDLITVRDLDQLLNQIIDRAMRLLDGEAGGVYLYRPERQVLEWVVSLGDNVVPLGTSIKKGEGLSGKIWETGEPEIITDYQQWEGKSGQWPDLKASVIGVPIQRGDDFLGVINIRTKHDPHNQFTEEDVVLMTQFASQAAIALENARHYEATQSRLNRLAALREIDIAITASLDLQITFQVILDQIMTTLTVDAVDILLLDSHTQYLEYAARKGFQTGALRHTRLRLGQGFAGLAALERRTVHIEDLEKSTGDMKRSHELHREGFVTYFAAPLIAKGKVKGVLEVFHRARFHPDAEWLSFLETLAGQVAIATDNASLFNDLERSNLELILAYDTTLEGWAKALELRDKETQGHTDRVTGLTLQLARAMGVSDQEMVHIRRGAILHDIGKMGIPDQILLKPGPLTDEEWDIMRQHTVYARDLLAPIAFLAPALEIPYSHHEKWDGSGYPEGLAGEEIPLAARIFAIVDVWDALRSDRPYRPAWSDEKAIDYIREQAGTHFDPQVVDSFLALIEYDWTPVAETA